MLYTVYLTLFSGVAIRLDSNAVLEEGGRPFATDRSLSGMAWFDLSGGTFAVPFAHSKYILIQVYLSWIVNVILID